MKLNESPGYARIWLVKKEPAWSRGATWSIGTQPVMPAVDIKTDLPLASDT